MEELIKAHNEYKYMDSLFLENHKSMDKLELFSEKTLKVEDISNGVVLPYKVVDGKGLGGVCDKDRNYIQISAFKALSIVDSWEGGYETEAVQEVSETVVYMGRFWTQWGHFTMDLISRLWYLLDNPGMKIAVDSKKKISGVYMSFLELLGIKEKQLIYVSEPTRFEKVIVPECSHAPGIYFTKEYKKIFDTAISRAMEKFDLKKAADKIYLSRAHLNIKHPTEKGENEIEEVFVGNGFKSIYPEELSLIDQIGIINSAKEIACVAGTLPHNFVFAAEETKVYIIRKSYKPNYRQVTVNDMRRLKVVWLDCHISLYAVGAGGPFLIDKNENADRFFTDMGFEFEINAVKQKKLRRKKILWYRYKNFRMNRKSNHTVPLFINGEFVNSLEASKKMYDFYKKRV